MMNDLDRVKAHLRIDHDAEDSLIAVYMTAAEDWIRNFINGEEGALPGEDQTPVVYPGSIIAAHLLVVADMYENRQGEGSDTLNINPTVRSLLYPYRTNMGA